MTSRHSSPDQDTSDVILISSLGTGPTEISKPRPMSGLFTSSSPVNKPSHVSTTTQARTVQASRNAVPSSPMLPVSKEAEVLSDDDLPNYMDPPSSFSNFNKPVSESHSIVYSEDQFFDVCEVLESEKSPEPEDLTPKGPTKKPFDNTATKDSSSPLFVRTADNTPAFSSTKLNPFSRTSHLLSTPTRAPTVTGLDSPLGKAMRSKTLPSKTTTTTTTQFTFSSSSPIYIDESSKPTTSAYEEELDHLQGSRTPPPKPASRFQPLPLSSPIFQSGMEFPAPSASAKTVQEPVLIDSEDEDIEVFSTRIAATCGGNTDQASASRKKAWDDSQETQSQTLHGSSDDFELEFEKELDRMVQSKNRKVSKSSNKVTKDFQATLPEGQKKLTKRQEREIAATRRRIEKAIEKAEEKKKAEALRALNDANRRLSLHKDKALSELILTLEPDFAKSKLGLELISLLEFHKVKHEVDALAEPILSTQQGTTSKRLSNIASTVIKLKRRVTTRYDVERALFVPIDQPFVESVGVHFRLLDMSLLNVNDFLSEIAQDTFRAGTEEITCVIQGHAQLIRKLANERSQKVASRVRELMGHQVSASTLHRRKQQARQRERESTEDGDDADQPVTDPTVLENMLLDLQFKKNWKVVHTKDNDDTLEWLIVLFRDLSVKWYKTRDNSMAESSTADIGFVRTGNGPLDVTVKSLQQVKFVSANIANTIGNAYGNMMKLASEFDRPSGRGNLESLRTVSQAGGRSISKNVIKTLELILTSQDPDHIVQN